MNLVGEIVLKISYSKGKMDRLRAFTPPNQSVCAEDNILLAWLYSKLKDLIKAYLLFMH